MSPADPPTPPERPARRRKAKRRPPQLRENRPTIRRESVGYTARTTVLLTADLYGDLVRFGRAKKITLPEAIRRAAREGLIAILARIEEEEAAEKAQREDEELVALARAYDPGPPDRSE